MASYLRSFGGSSMLKRLLRYALSRLELLDTEALDLDKLDLAWGKNNVFKFQDVGIRLKKLERLLQLPPSFRLQKAKILSLRVTIPAAIYVNPIIVEVEGVQVKLKVVSDNAKSQGPWKSRDDGNSNSKKGANADKDLVPDVIDLAQSFLETQPSKERAELQAALEAEAQSQDLIASTVSSSEDGSDEDAPIGTGQPLSLPAFLADFLQGIVDRTQISIKAVAFQLNIDVPVDMQSSATEAVTFQLDIEDIQVQGVTLQGNPTKTEQSRQGENEQAASPKDGKRHILLSKIRASLISEASMFRVLTRASSNLSSKSTNPGDSPVTQEHGFLARDVMSDSDPLSHSLYHPRMMDSEDALDIPYDLDGLDEGDLQEEMARTVQSTPSPPSTPSTPRARTTPRALTPSRTNLRPFYGGPSTVTGQAAEPWSSMERDSRSEADIQRFTDWNDPSQALAFEQSPMESPNSLLLSDHTTPQPDEGLAQSRLFSHEDAESMYMSAFSQRHGSPSGDPAVPGSWGVSSPSANTVQNQSDVSPELRSPERIETTETATATGDYHRSPSIPDARSNSSEVMNPELSAIREQPKPQEPDDEASTPQGSTRIMKEILNMASMSIYIPSNHQTIMSNDQDINSSNNPLQSSQQGRPVAKNMPGAFSVHESLADSESPLIFSSSMPAIPEKLTPLPQDESIEVTLAPLEISFDANIGFILVTTATRILDMVLQSGKKSTPKRSTNTPAITSSPSRVQVTAQKISILFLESLAGVTDTPGRNFASQSFSLGSNALLVADLQNLHIDMSPQGATTLTSIDLEKFKFGYDDEEIISFDNRLQMRASISDGFPVEGSDVSVRLEQGPDFTKCDIKTLPLHVKLDLGRLDDMLSWFGGLSSFLNMGASMTSNPIMSSSTTPATPSKPRGVRFDAPIRADDESAVFENKTNVRVGGLRLDIFGKECSVSLDTTAIKVVTREEGIGVGITKIQLMGPFLRGSMADPPVSATLMNVRAEYVATPQDKDLERLLELILPSKYKFDENDDEIMVDTLIRQRRKGGVLRLNLEDFQVRVKNIPRLAHLPTLGEEIARLATVAKYLPEDDRPGILTLALVRRCDFAVDANKPLGNFEASLRDLELGHISLPSLVAAALSSVALRRDEEEELIGLTTSPSDSAAQGPVLTLRIIPDALEPAVKVLMRRLNFEYRVSTVMDLLGLGQDATPQDYETMLAASVANLGEQAHVAITGQRPAPNAGKAKGHAAKPTKVDLVLRDCTVGLNPLGRSSKMLVVLTDAHVEADLAQDRDDVKATTYLNKASILLVDDVAVLDSSSTYKSRRRSSNASTAQVLELCSRGYVDICYMSSAKATILVGTSSEDGSKFIDVEVRDDLLVMETCADSMQTLIGLANALQPPTPEAKGEKYRTEIVPVQDLLASISADAFGVAEGTFDFDDDFGLAQALGGDDLDNYSADEASQASSLEADSRYYDEARGEDEPGMGASIMSDQTRAEDTHDGVLLTNFSTHSLNENDGHDLNVDEDHFHSGSAIKGTAHRWNSARNAYDNLNNTKLQRSPVTVRVRDVHVIWNLFDGYDWSRTREVITKAVEDVETKAFAQRARGDHQWAGGEADALVDEEETVIGDFLFNSIYIGVPANRDPRELAQRINQELNDNVTETESIATTAMTATPSRAVAKQKKLKLDRSKRHKITFELKGINVDFVAFPPDSGETQSSIDVRVRDLDIFDHVPTSTWKKFATYDQDAGEREMDTSMVHLEILNVRPVQSLLASEIVLKVTLLPLRLHVDQDALDFITRFFEFKDDSAPLHASEADVPFVQRAEISSIPVKLDFKPKRVDYAGLRSGHTTEFMNFLILDEARMVLRHTIVYGVSGFDRLGETLNDIWMPDVKANQLPGILAGLAPFRSLVNVGSGVKDLVEIPIKEYKKDGRIIRSFSKGATAFAKTTGTELVKLGAKVAVGTQYVLQGAEDMLVNKPDARRVGWEDEDGDSEETKQISLYADQPRGVVQGIRGGYSSLARDLSLTRDAIIAIPGAVTQSQSAQGAAKAVLTRAPTIIFRPLIGSTKAIGQTLMGATNSLDPHNQRRVDEKYKKH